MRFLRRGTRRARIASPRPPVEGQDAAPQTPLHKDLFVQIDVGVEIVIGCNLVLDENTAIYVQLDRK